MKDIIEKLKNILGEDAFNTGDMQVSDTTQKLVKSVNYLITQLKIISELEDNVRKEYVDNVLENVKEILNDE